MSGAEDAQCEYDDQAGDDEEPADRQDPEAAEDGDHLDDVADGCGCAEIWEHLSDRRADD